MKINISPIDKASVCEIISWRYEPPYDVYNLEDTEGTLQYALDPSNRFFAMKDASGALVGFCSFGEDGQVPGGDYSESALDIGMGIRPDLTGQGRGVDYAASVVEYAHQAFSPRCLRVTIASFNTRAQRVWDVNGFHPIQQFIHATSGLDFVVMVNGELDVKTR